jgi:flavin-dependent dehydrogenase
MDYEFHSIFQHDSKTFSIDRKRFNISILDIIKQLTSPHIDLFFPHKVMSVKNLEDKEWEFDVLDENVNKKLSLYSPIFIDATGRRAYFSRYVGAENITDDFLIAAAVFYEFPENTPISNQIITETTSDGWWYMNTLPNNKKILAFMTDTQVLNKTSLYQPHVWKAKIQNTTLILPEINGLSPIEKQEKIRVYNSHSRHLLNPATKRWIASGDAACSFDPLAPLGIGNAFLSGIKAAEVFKTKNFEEYTKDININFSSYLKNRHQIYLLEKRWISEPFWKKRHN